MSSDVLLKQVFTPGGQPSVTYVSRSHLGLEQRVREALMRGYAINVVTGPTKSGKTVLCNHVLAEAGKSVTIEGGQVRSEQDFWEQIAYNLDVGSQRTRKEVGGANDNLELSAGLKSLTASVGIKAGRAN